VPFALDYVAPPSCPDEMALRAGVITKVGRNPSDANAPDHIVVRIEATKDGFVGSVAASGADARPVMAQSCKDAVDTIELQIATFVQPQQPTQPVQPYVQPYRPYVATAWPPPPPPPERPRRELGIAIGSVSGSHPESATVLGLRAGYVLPRWWFGAVARVATQEGNVDAQRDARTQTVEILAEACSRRWLVLGCVLAGAGAKSVRIDRDDGMFVITNVADYRDPYALVGASVALDVPLGRAFLRPGIEAAFPIPQVAIESEGVQRADLSSIQLEFELALGLRW